MYHKDLLNLIFLEFEDGRNMLNFSEINRKCHQIFYQHIKIEANQRNTWMENMQGQLHGILHGWYSSGKMRYKLNYIQDQRHGICRWWYANGQLAYEHNYMHDQKHGISRGWYENEKLIYEHHYHHGQKIEK